MIALRPAAGLVLAAVLLAATPGPVSAALSIEDIGLQGWSPPETALNRVRVHVTNEARRAADFSLDVEISSDAQGMTARGASRFQIPLRLQDGEARTVDVPVVLQVNETVTATLRDTQGQISGRGQRRAVRASQTLVVLVCEPEPLCQALQSRITFAGTDEARVSKRRSLHFEVLRDSPASWWAYTAASVVVVARPSALLSPAQRDALEAYARQGGRLVIIDELTGPGWLDAYPESEDDGWVIGVGRLHRIRSLQSQGIEGIFAGRTLGALLERPGGTVAATHDEVSWAMARLGTSLQVPGVSWLLGWLGAYIVVATLVNFTVLRRLERREWAWISVPVIAVVFAGALYVTASALQPKQTQIDETAVYWMDDRSPWAAGETAVRIFSVARGPATLTVSTDGVLAQLPAAGRGMFAALRSPSDLPVIEVRTGPPQSVRLTLERGGASDLVFRTMRRLPGAVRRVGPTSLVNESGLDFTEAFLIDAQSVRILGPLKGAATSDVAAAAIEPLARHVGRRYRRYNSPMGTAAVSTSDARVEPAPEAIPPFSPLEWLGPWPRADTARALGPRSAIFIGRAERSTLEPRLDGGGARRPGHTIVVVSMAPTS